MIVAYFLVSNALRFGIGLLKARLEGWVGSNLVMDFFNFVMGFFPLDLSEPNIRSGLHV